ncbi:MAG: TetR/AcrR family transcriptional regulator [Proteobacteria bacterium]|nr:TetR/AcrR family transcriptional regulator [Pseudomonadota bacterium]NDC24991.1 TetR/AcrR family transcriptional regulator [Pseudomonadota bacterium]NDD05045.1 TetR/AcrR family transcriptional regulator [Pseudomonadota bacterium]NDG27528.1 TetR/AcrR family transcriptional regulator [Pseudomonadota bacterium]
MGIKERKAREKSQRTNDILEAARQIFERKGFLNTPLQDVAKEAEISVGLIYRYFLSKEDIFASLALKGAEQYDKRLETLIKKAKSAKNRSQVTDSLVEVAESFFAFYGLYGEYFDMLLYSYKGMKEVQIQATTLTRLMSVTLSSLDRLKTFVQDSPFFKAKDEDEALRTVFLLWGLLLGCHKLFDSSGRGHLFAFQKDTFIRQIIEQIFSGVAASTSDLKDSAHFRSKTSKPSASQDFL